MGLKPFDVDKIEEYFQVGFVWKLDELIHHEIEGKRVYVEETTRCYLYQNHMWYSDDRTLEEYLGG